MNVKLDGKDGFNFDYELTDQNIADANAFMTLVSSPEWKRFQDYLEYAREQILDEIKTAAINPDQAAGCAAWSRVLSGFDRCSKMPQIFAEQVKHILKQKELHEEENRESNNDPTDAGFVGQ